MNFKDFYLGSIPSLCKARPSRSLQPTLSSFGMQSEPAEGSIAFGFKLSSQEPKEENLIPAEELDFFSTQEEPELEFHFNGQTSHP